MPPLEHKPIPRPFPFLRLPKHIRRQIYEYLPVRTKYVPGYRGESNDRDYKDRPVAFLVLRYVERIIVQTCRQLSTEAEPILEIETMKLGPARLIVAAEYFHRIPQDMRFLRRMQDDPTWPRLRISDRDRGSKSLEDQRVLMWARILQLNLLSEKCIRFGIFVGQQVQQGGGQRCLSKISEHLDDILEQRWWTNGLNLIACGRPRYEVTMEWDGCDGGNIVTWAVVQRGGMQGYNLAHSESLKGDYGVHSFGELFPADEGL